VQRANARFTHATTFSPRPLERFGAKDVDGVVDGGLRQPTGGPGAVELELGPGDRPAPGTQVTMQGARLALEDVT